MTTYDDRLHFQTLYEQTPRQFAFRAQTMEAWRRIYVAINPTPSAKVRRIWEATSARHGTSG